MRGGGYGVRTQNKSAARRECARRRGYGDATSARHSMAIRGLGRASWRPKGGEAKSPEPSLWTDRCPPHRQIYFSLAAIFGQRPGEVADRRAGRGQPSRWGFRQSNFVAAPLLLTSPPELGAFAVWFCDPAREAGKGPVFSHYASGIREAIFMAGTLGTWELGMSNRQNVGLSDEAIMFPSRQDALGTWEQKCPMPMAENPRACGSPLPPRSGDRG